MLASRGREPAVGDSAGVGVALVFDQPNGQINAKDAIVQAAIATRWDLRPPKDAIMFATV